MSELEVWRLDQEINRAGVPFNRRMVRNAIKIVEYFREKYHAELKEITGVENTNSNPQLLGWLRENGYPFRDMKAGHIKTAFAKAEEVSDLKRVLELRMEVSRTSVDKYYAFERGCDDDDRLRNTLQFAGAQRTSRWGGRIGQLQNPPRPTKDLEKMLDVAAKHVEVLRPQEIELIYAKPFDLLASTVRPCVQAPEGYMLIGADLNAIENRVLGWLADDRKILGVFEKDRCPYIDFATRMFGEDYDTLFAEYKAGDKTKRTIAKPPTLGCGFGLSAGEETFNEETGEVEATGLLGYAQNMGVKLTPEQAELAVRVWRETFVDVVDFWYQVEKSAKQCVRTGEPTRVRHIEFDRSGPFLRMHLPSGRAIHYCRPRLDEVVLYWCEEQEKYQPLHRCRAPRRDKTRTRQSLSYEGLNDKKQWARIPTWHGKLVENPTQAIARDILAEGLKRAKRRGLDVRLHLHDEIVAVSREDRAERELEILIECMSEPIDWAPSLLLKAEGGVSKIWLKD